MKLPALSAVIVVQFWSPPERRRLSPGRAHGPPLGQKSRKALSTIRTHRRTDRIAMTVTTSSLRTLASWLRERSRPKVGAPCG